MKVVALVNRGEVKANTEYESICKLDNKSIFVKTKNEYIRLRRKEYKVKEGKLYEQGNKETVQETV